MPWSAVWRGSRRSMDTNRCHRASRCALQAPRMAIAVSDGLQKKGDSGHERPCMPSWGSSCKSPRARMCPGAMSGGVRGARWTQIDAIARADVPWRPVERRLPCQMNCRKVWDRALTGHQPGSEGRVWQVCVRSVSGRRSSCKPSRESMCPGVLWNGDCRDR